MACSWLQGPRGSRSRDFHPCEPWFLRIRDDEGAGFSVTVWQATEPEPVEPQLTSLPASDASLLVIGTFGFSPTPSRELMIDWLRLSVHGGE